MKSSIKEYKKPLIGLGLIALVILIYATKEQWMNFFLPRGLSKDSNTPVKPSSTNTPSETIDRNQLLKKGDRGLSVQELQRLLNAEHDYQSQHGTVPIEAKLVVDQIFGAKTEALLFKFTNKKTMSIHQLQLILANQKN
ncbi:peptidoglycan-binding domain-containing protein [Aureispira anguillae]|uniref:Uncharacterized protein n=1 Tax=Aureispira anguillae TaxID=2864201 RepID=A0A916DS39_9BACT|nr:hypothetical protein [Aureispira anguillae]BDS10571.1 hypothetical protein AsAng_0012790 [Aureispira anguillae]